MGRVRIHAFKPPEASLMEWLPLAVRFKLDVAGLKIGLSEWQALAVDKRLSLLGCPFGRPFEALLVRLMPQVRRIPGSGRSYGDYLLAKLSAEAMLTLE